MTAVTSMPAPEAGWLPLQEKLAALTHDGRLVVAEQSGHFIPGDQPELVIDLERVAKPPPGLDPTTEETPL